MKRKRHARKITRCAPGYADGVYGSPTARSKRAASGFFDETPLHESREVRSRQSLFRAIIAQHVMDAKSRSQKPDKLRYRDEALHWLFDDTDSFYNICDFAGFEPDVIRQKLKAARARGFIWRDETPQAVKERGTPKSAQPIVATILPFAASEKWPQLFRPKKPSIKHITRRFHTPVWQQLAFEFVRA